MVDHHAIAGVAMSHLGQLLYPVVNCVEPHSFCLKAVSGPPATEISCAVLDPRHMLQFEVQVGDIHEHLLDTLVLYCF